MSRVVDWGFFLGQDKDMNFKKSFSFGLSALLFAVIFSGCGHKSAPTTVLFNGECRLEVKSQTDHSEILVDGVEVGHDEALLQVPCGERLVEVHKSGYIPYLQYFPVSIDRPVSVSVTLQKRSRLVNLALESSLIEKVRGPIVVAKKDKKSNDASAPAQATTSPSGSGSGAGQWTQYEDWL